MQFLFLRALKPYVVLLFTGMLLFTTGCEDDDHDHDHEEGHTDADGFVLKGEDGVEVYREFEGDQTGGVTLSVGETLELTVHFLDHEENEIEDDHDDHGDDHDDDGDDHDDDSDGLIVDQFNSAVATVEVEGHDEEEGDDQDDHGDEHGNALHVEGVSAGTTSFRLRLMHDGHSDYTSTNPVPVTVSEN